jgi:ligand-binding sensor protein
MERITSISGNNSFSEAFFLTAKPHIDYIAQKLNITPIQVVLFSHIVEEYEGHAITLNQIARSLNCGKIKIMQYTGELADLISKKILKGKKNKNDIYSCNKGEIMYQIPLHVSESLQKDEAYTPVNYTNLSILDFFAAIEELFVQCVQNREISYEELVDEIDSLLDDNKELSFVKKLKGYSLSIDERMMLIRFCHFFVNKDLDEMDLEALFQMFDYQAKSTQHKRKLITGEHNLIISGIIENANSDGFSNRELFKLADRTKKELLSDIQIKKVFNSKDMIQAKSIKEKKLFYNAVEEEQVNRLSSLLAVDSFKECKPGWKKTT